MLITFTPRPISTLLPISQFAAIAELSEITLYCPTCVWCPIETLFNIFEKELTCTLVLIVLFGPTYIPSPKIAVSEI